MANARVGILSCTHGPFTPKKPWAWVLKQLAGADLTHLVHLGDWIDTDPANPHGTEESHTQAEEYETAARQSKELRTAVGKNVVLLRHNGNHEDRLELWSPNIPKRLRSLTHWTRDPVLKKEWSQWKSVPYIKGKAGVTQIGQLVLYHGFDVGVNTDELEGLQMILACGAHPNMLAIRGHTHRPLDVTQMQKTQKIPLPWYYANVGHTGPEHPNYMRRKDVSQWGQALMIVEAKMGDPAKMSGRCWDAELRRYPG
jgi:predicted phosphodiesterase